MMHLVTYNRKEKVYQYTDSTGQTYSAAGAAGKGKMFRLAVEIEHAELYEAALKAIALNPHLERAYWKACELVTQSAVTFGTYEVSGIFAMVASSDGFGSYAIQSQDGLTTCQCPHYQNGDAPREWDTMQPICKHIAAYRLAAEIQDKF